MKILHKVMSLVIVCAMIMSMGAVAIFNTAASAAVWEEPVNYSVTKGDIVTYEVELSADKPFENIQATVEYDSDVLELITHKYDSDTGKEYKISTKTMFPALSGVVYNVSDLGYVKFNASMLDKFDFTEGGMLLSLEFIAKTTAITDIGLNIVYMTIDADNKEAYFADGVQLISKGLEVSEAAVKAAFTPVATLFATSFEYDGTPKTPEVKVTYGDLLLKEGTDYTVDYYDNTNAGTARAEVSYIGKYSGEKNSVLNFIIARGFTVDGKQFEAERGDKITYTVDIAAAQAFENIQARVSFDPKVLELVSAKYDANSGTEYNLKTVDRVPNLTGVVFNDADAGFVKFNASSLDRFDFSKGKTLITLEFVVKSSAGCAIGLEIQEMTIDAEKKLSYFSGSKPVITDGITVIKDAVVTEFAPEITLTPSVFVYDGKAKTPEVKVVFADMLLHEGDDYCVAYSDNTKVGTAKATVSFLDKYSGDFVKNFVITSGYVDPDTNIIIDETYGNDVEIDVVKDNEDVISADFDLVGKSIKDVYEIKFVDGKTGNVVTPSSPVNVRIPCDSNDAELYMMNNDGTVTKINGAVNTDGHLVLKGRSFGMLMVAEPTAPYLLGDANGDNVVNIKDVTIIQKHIASIKTAPLTGFEFANVNGDTGVNIKDASAIQKYIADIETGHSIGKLLK